MNAGSSVGSSIALHFFPYFNGREASVAGRTDEAGGMTVERLD